MTGLPGTIWDIPAYLPYLQPDLTDELIEEAESQIGFRLPSEYLELLRVQNGGYIRYRLPESPHSMIYGIGPHFPTVTAVDWEEDREYVTIELDGLVPFDGDGHWHLCLDYRGGGSHPGVTYVDIECDRETKLARSFAEYLKQLKLEFDPENIVLQSVADIEDLKQRLASLMGITFGEPDTWAHGYPVHQARCSDSKPEWIWISPNLVPRGFVRVDDPRYDELREKMPGMEKRYEGLPAESYILSATEAVRPRVLDAFRAASIEVQTMRQFLGVDGS